MSRRRKPFSEYGPRVQKKLPDAAVPVNSHGDSMAFFGADMAASAISTWPSASAMLAGDMTRFGD